MVVFMHVIWQVMLELAPWLLVGSLVAGMLHILLPAGFLQRQFSGSLGIFKAVGLGVPLPLCSCAVIPVGLSLKQGGASDGATVAFLISTPQTGIDSVLVSAAFLGWPFALFKVVSAAITGLLGGWWTDLQPHRAALPILPPQTPVATHPVSRTAALLTHSLELLRSIWRWLLLGVVVSAAIQAFVPAGTLSGYTGGSDIIAMLVTLAIALPLYVCATASVPIAAALVASGLPVGAALVFLMAGPATNVATIGSVYRTLGKRALVIYLSTVVLGSIACGWLFGFLVAGEASRAHPMHNEPTWWSIASAAVLLLLFGLFALQDARRMLSPTGEPTSKTSCCE